MAFENYLKTRRNYLLTNDCNNRIITTQEQEHGKRDKCFLVQIKKREIYSSTGRDIALKPSSLRIVNLQEKGSNFNRAPNRTNGVKF
jgi:hypothetical protein